MLLGLKVRLLYRSENTVPERFMKNENVEKVCGNVISLDDCKKTIDKVDAVCVILGTRNQLAATTELSQGTNNIITAMKDANVKRISIVMSSFLFRPLEEVPPMFHRLNEEHQRMLDLTKASGLDYIAILPPHIAEEPASAYTIMHDEAPGRAVSKYDLAKFIVDCLEQKEHFGKVCGIAKKSNE